MKLEIILLFFVIVYAAKAKLLDESYLKGCGCKRQAIFQEYNGAFVNLTATSLANILAKGFLKGAAQGRFIA